MPNLLRITLQGGAIFFCFMAAAHFFGPKVPILFVYWDTPYHAYQDKIISFAVLAYVGLFYAASRDIAVVPVALAVLGATVLGLSSVNLSDALASVLAEGQSTWAYWAQTTAIAGYLAVLVVLYRGRSET